MQGSSAIQIVPSLQPRVKHLVNYVRGKTWISSTFAKETLLKLSPDEKIDNCMYIDCLLYTIQFLQLCLIDKFTEMDLENFKDLEHFRGFRRNLEQDLNVSSPSLYCFDTCSTSLGGPSSYHPRKFFGSNCES